MLSLLKGNSTGARLWISDQRPDDYRRELTKIYDALEKLFQIERNVLLVPILLAVISAIIALIATPPSFSATGWQASVGLCAGVLLGVFVVSSVGMRFFARGAHRRILEGLQLQAGQKRVQVIIKHLSDQDRSIRPLVQRYHLAGEQPEKVVRFASARSVPPKQAER